MSEQIWMIAKVHSESLIGTGVAWSALPSAPVQPSVRRRRQTPWNLLGRFAWGAERRPSPAGCPAPVC
jgi:hypothetical protein